MTGLTSDTTNELDNLIKQSQWTRARSVLSGQNGPSLSRKPDPYGNVALHTAIGYKAPDDFVLDLLRTYPEATRLHGTDYWTPLRVAAMWGASVDVIEALIRVWPEALDDTGSEGVKGRCPSHFSTKFEGRAREALERSVVDWKLIIAQEKGV